MPTEWTSDLFGFSSVEGRNVVAGFDGGAVTSEAGALLLGATDRAIGRGGAVHRVLRGWAAPSERRSPGGGDGGPADFRHRPGLRGSARP